MKKTIIIAFTLILVLASFTSCENNIHEHTWDKGTVTKEATCTEAGVITYTCTGCKETETKALEALGHSWDEGVVTEKATYLEKGTKTITCNRCNITKEEEIPVIPINGSSFIIINGYYDGNLSCMGFEFDENKCFTYDGIGKKVEATDTPSDEEKVTTPVEFELSLQLMGSGSYELDLDSKQITLQQQEDEGVFSIKETINNNGDVEYVTISITNDNVMNLIPITINKKSLEAAKAEGHYYKAECDFKTSISIPQSPEGASSSEGLTETTPSEEENTSETTMEIAITSIIFGPYNHLGDYTVVGDATPGYITMGTVKWNNCTVCGYNKESPMILSLENTKWYSKNTISTEDPKLGIINGKKLIIEFNDHQTAKISAESESEISDVDTINYYSLNLNSSPKTIYLNGTNDWYYYGQIEENINDKTLKLIDFSMYHEGLKVAEIGDIVFTQNKQ